MPLLVAAALQLISPDILMSDLRSSIHSFRSPPVVETAIAAQFEELTSFRAVDFGLYYRKIDSRFPIAEDQLRAEPIIEVFPAEPRQMALKLSQMRAGPERVWFRDKVDGALLLQLQPDRFGLNWTRIPEQEEYPRFCQNGALFMKEYAEFERFCEEQGLGRLRPNLCEVIYVNHISPLAGESAIECMGRVLAGVSFDLGDGVPVPELVSFNRVYPIGDRKGRLYAEAAIGRLQGKSDFVLLKMTARVVLREGDVLGESVQLAHDSLVNGFVAVTTADAKKHSWGLTQ